MAKKAAARSRSAKGDGPKGPDLDTSTDVVDAAPARTRAQKKEEADRKAAAADTREPIVQPKNPPDQPAMTPAKQVEGFSGQALDPDDLPANRRDPANTIRVQAKAIGYYDDVMRRVGDVFDIANEQAFSSKWMKRVPSSTPEQVTGSNAALEKAKKGGDPNRTVPEPALPAAGGDDVLGD